MNLKPSKSGINEVSNGTALLNFRVPYIQTSPSRIAFSATMLALLWELMMSEFGFVHHYHHSKDYTVVESEHSNFSPVVCGLPSDMTLLVEQDAVCNIFQVLRVWCGVGMGSIHSYRLMSSSPNAAKKPVPWSPSLSPLFRCPRDLHELLSTACWSAKLLDSQLCSSDMWHQWFPTMRLGSSSH